MLQLKIDYSHKSDGIIGGEVVECLMHIREHNSSENFLIRKMRPTSGRSGAAGLNRFINHSILYQSPNYSKEEHDNKEYWWVGADRCKIVEWLPKTNRESVSFLEK